MWHASAARTTSLLLLLFFLFFQEAQEKGETYNYPHFYESPLMFII